MSLTCQTTTAATSIGLPSASLTLSWVDSWLRILVETTSRLVNGFTRFRPGSRIVPQIPAEQLDDSRVPRADRSERPASARRRAV